MKILSKFRNIIIVIADDSKLRDSKKDLRGNFLLKAKGELPIPFLHRYRDAAETDKTSDRNLSHPESCFVCYRRRKNQFT